MGLVYLNAGKPIFPCFPNNNNNNNNNNYYYYYKLYLRVRIFNLKAKGGTFQRK